MVRQRALSAASNNSSIGNNDQELGSMYDYLAKIILLGPSASGKSCLLHRFVKDEWRVLSSQTIGVEFSSRIVKVGTGSRRKRIKLQLWDTAGTERFRSVSRSYYRGAAGALLVYDITSTNSFSALPNFLNDARALASPELSLILVGNKLDVADGSPNHNASNDAQSETRSIANTAADDASLIDGPLPPPTPSSVSTRRSYFGDAPQQPSTPTTTNGSIRNGSTGLGLGAVSKATTAPDGREVRTDTASAWATSRDIPVAMEVSALSGENVEDVFSRLARMILTKIELGEVDPDDPQSGIQYGDSGAWDGADGTSVKSGMGMSMNGDGGARRRRRGGAGAGAGGSGGTAGGGGGALGSLRGRTGTWVREWEEVFRLDVPRRRGGCC